MGVGVTDVDISGTSNVTLTTSNGAEDQARSATLELTGILGADIELHIPSVDWKYFIRGSWTGAYTVTVKINGSTTSVVMSSGDKRVVYTNGTDTYDMVDVDISDLLVNSNNLSDVSDAATSRTNLGLGDIAVNDVGTGFDVSGGVIDVAATDLVGEVKMYAASSLPSGWLNCDGVAVSRTTYSALFAIIGTQFGIGDGATTFNLPDLKGRMPIGVGQGSATGEGDVTGTLRGLGDASGYETHTLTVDELASHRHTYDSNLAGSGGGNDSVSTTTNVSLKSTSYVGGDAAHNNMAPFLALTFIIFANV